MSEWKSKSEDTSVSIPMPKDSGDGNKHANVDTYGKDFTHGKFDGGSWDPSTSYSEPKGSGWDSKSETPGKDTEDDD